MKLSHLLGDWFTHEDVDCDILDLQNDSRKVKAGDLFFAYPGSNQDGRLFIDKALTAGAAAIAYDPCELSSPPLLSVPTVSIPQLAGKLAKIANRFYNNPSSFLQVTGITGTNGKTTIAYQLAQAHHLLGTKSAYIGTIGQGEVNQLQELSNTTPDALCLMKLLHDYKNRNIQQVCMEVSSHALSQNRVDAIEFDQAVFTNLTQDHLDYHKSMQAYGAAKALLFVRPELKFAILNQDDPFTTAIANQLNPGVKKITYGMHDPCDVQAVEWTMDVQGTTIGVQSPWGRHQLRIGSLGLFNIYNSLALFSSLLLSDYPPEDVVQIMSQLKAAPGRMEVVLHTPYVLVDYAHTPDALEKALSTLSDLKKGQLWVVFGCGGDRDKTKRPLMGRAASIYADHILITSDNPRNEDPKRIIDEIATGIPKGIHVNKIMDREEAIAYALEHAEKDDIVLIAGKGHESYQQIGQVKHPFSDQEVIRRLVSRA
ncbi:MAG: UDP-N-acetylmuramoyl-L-alanyl-D-glutamate--2,6-diaminopimelate ligase [Legionella sp.]|nr:UDP-N-acetylmuramoyl-L-alanyl-D-glutamate--2,6-diaminopimelate ligase [Legionella sp.]